jgi:hypothetical protein
MQRRIILLAVMAIALAAFGGVAYSQQGTGRRKRSYTRANGNCRPDAWALTAGSAPPAGAVR